MLKCLKSPSAGMAQLKRQPKIGIYKNAFSITSPTSVKFSITLKVKLGFSLAIVAVLTIGGIAGYTYSNFLHARHTIVCGSVAFAGLFLWIMEHLCADRDSKIETHKPDQEHPLAFLTRLGNWGLIMVLSAGAVYAWTSTRQLRVSARVPKPPPKLSTPTPPVPRPPTAFPPLALQGIILGPKPTALINGQVLCVGEGIGNVEV